MRLRRAAAADAARASLRCGGAGADPPQGRRQSEDRPARRHDAGADVARRPTDVGLDSGRSARGDAGSGTTAGAGDARPAQDAPAVAELSSPPRPRLALRSLDQDAPAVVGRARLRASGTTSGARGDAAADRAFGASRVVLVRRSSSVSSVAPSSQPLAEP